MKLQKQLSRKVGNKEYSKWVVTIPPMQIKALGWREGEYLESEIKNGELIVKQEDPEKARKRSEAAKKAWVKRRAHGGNSK